MLHDTSFQSLKRSLFKLDDVSLNNVFTTMPFNECVYLFRILYMSPTSYPNTRLLNQMSVFINAYYNKTYNIPNILFTTYCIQITFECDPTCYSYDMSPAEQILSLIRELSSNEKHILTSPKFVCYSVNNTCGAAHRLDTFRKCLFDGGSESFYGRMLVRWLENMEDGLKYKETIIRLKFDSSCFDRFFVFTNMFKQKRMEYLVNYSLAYFPLKNEFQIDTSNIDINSLEGDIQKSILYSDGRLIRHLTNPDIEQIFVAMNSDGTALEFINENHEQYKEICFVACFQTEDALKFIKSESILHEIQFLLKSDDENSMTNKEKLWLRLRGCI